MKAIAWIFGIAFVGGILLGVWWCFWKLWCWVLPQMWATGPENLIKPSYWLFVALLLLIGVVGRAVFGSSTSKAD